MNAFYTIIRGLVWLPFKIMYPVKVIGKRNMPRRQKLITVSNHLKWADLPIIAINVPGYRHIIAKRELGKNPVVCALATWLGIIFVDRGKVDLTTIRTAIKVLKKGEGITIFPEGTRNKKDETVQEVKSGAAMFALKGDAPLVPIMVHHRARVFRKNYLYVGEPFRLDRFKGRMLDMPTLAEAAEIVSEKMIEAKAYLDDFVARKRWKEMRLFRREVIRANRQGKKALKSLKKEAAGRKGAQTAEKGSGRV